jgi:hypothetical protein
VSGEPCFCIALRHEIERDGTAAARVLPVRGDLKDGGPGETAMRDQSGFAKRGRLTAARFGFARGDGFE